MSDVTYSISGSVFQQGFFYENCSRINNVDHISSK
jgi:hypothetical protein